MAKVTKITLHKEFEVQIFDTQATGDYFLDQALVHLKGALIIGDDLNLADMPQHNERFTADDGTVYIVIGDPAKLIPPSPQGYSIRLLNSAATSRDIEKMGLEVKRWR